MESKSGIDLVGKIRYVDGYMKTLSAVIKIYDESNVYKSPKPIMDGQKVKGFYETLLELNKANFCDPKKEFVGNAELIYFGEAYSLV